MSLATVEVDAKIGAALAREKLTLPQFIERMRPGVLLPKAPELKKKYGLPAGRIREIVAAAKQAGLLRTVRYSRLERTAVNGTSGWAPVRTEQQYRLRWAKGHNHKTRYYARRHSALAAAERYENNGFDVELDERTVTVVDDWKPVVEEGWRSHRSAKASDPLTTKVRQSTPPKDEPTCTYCGKPESKWRGMCSDNMRVVAHRAEEAA